MRFCSIKIYEHEFSLSRMHARVNWEKPFAAPKMFTGRCIWYFKEAHGQAQLVFGTPWTLMGRHSWYSTDAHGQAHLVLHGCSWTGGDYEEVEA